jgi:hypothetical protein
VRYSWTATAPDPGDGGGGGIEPITTLPPKASFYVISKRLLRRGWLDVMVSCNRACQVTAWAQMPKATRTRRAVRTSRRSATLALPGKRARLRLKLSRRTKRQLQAALRRKRRVSVRVNLRVIPAGSTKTQAYSKKVVVRRPKTRR